MATQSMVLYELLVISEVKCVILANISNISFEPLK